MKKVFQLLLLLLGVVPLFCFHFSLPRLQRLGMPLSLLRSSEDNVVLKPYSEGPVGNALGNSFESSVSDTLAKCGYSNLFSQNKDKDFSVQKRSVYEYDAVVEGNYDCWTKLLGEFAAIHICDGPAFEGMHSMIVECKLTYGLLSEWVKHGRKGAGSAAMFLNDTEYPSTKALVINGGSASEAFVNFLNNGGEPPNPRDEEFKKLFEQQRINVLYRPHFSYEVIKEQYDQFAAIRQKIDMQSQKIDMQSQEIATLKKRMDTQ